MIPVLTLTSTGGDGKQTATIESITWTRLRCEVRVRPQVAGMTADIRTKAASAQSSIAKTAKPVAEGTASLLVVDEELEGHAAFVVVLDSEGSVLAQEQTAVGG